MFYFKFYLKLSKEKKSPNFVIKNRYKKKYTTHITNKILIFFFLCYTSKLILVCYSIDIPRKQRNGEKKKILIFAIPRRQRNNGEKIKERVKL